MASKPELSSADPLPDRIVHRGQTYVRGPLAAEHTFTTAAVLLSWRRFRCLALGGRKVGAIVRRRGNVPHWFYRQDDLDAIRAFRTNSNRRNRSGVALEDAAREWNVSAATAHRWCRAGCPALNGRKVRRERELSWDSAARRTQQTWVISKEEFDAVASAIIISLNGARDADWLTAAQAAERYAFSPHALGCWRQRNGRGHHGSRRYRCPLGRAIRARRAVGKPLGGKFGKGPEWEYSAADLAEIHRLLNNAPSAEFLTVNEAADRLGVRPLAIYQWMRHGCQWLEGKKLTYCRKELPNKGNTRLYARRLVRNADVDAIANARRRSHPARNTIQLHGGEWVTAREARRAFGIPAWKLSEFRKKPHPTLGRPVVFHEGRQTLPGPGVPPRYYYAAADLAAIAAAHGNGTPTQAEPEAAPPANGRKPKRGKRGRKRQHDPAEDAKIAERFRASGYASLKDWAPKNGMTAKDAKRAIERDRLNRLRGRTK